MDLFSMLGAARPEPDGECSSDEVAIDVDAFSREDVPVVETPKNEAMLEALWEVIDPEVGIDIVELGLVYAVERREARIDVVLTMTTPACPLSAVIEEDVREALLEAVDGVEEVRIAIIFDPPWSPEMMSDEAKMRLGR